MSKEKKVTVKMNARQAAAVRQVLFDSQKGYTYDPTCIPERVVDIREVIRDIDDNLGAFLGVNE